MKGERLRLRASRPFRNLVFSACCALGGGWVWDLPVPVGAVASAQPEVRASVPGEVAVSRDATVLARRILHRQGEELLVDERRLDRLAREIGSVLRLIRKRYPALAEIAARPPTGLRLEIKGALHDDIAGRWAGVSVGAVVNAGAVPPTEHAAFDALNARLGLRTVEFWPASGAIFLRFADRANPRAAVEAYAAIAGVADARLVRRRIDGSDIAMHKTSGNWHVVMRKAWGDCPSGCIHEETHFFAVGGGHVERTDVKIARGMQVFRTIEGLARLEW